MFVNHLGDSFWKLSKGIQLWEFTFHQETISVVRKKMTMDSFLGSIYPIQSINKHPLGTWYAPVLS